MSSNRPLTAAEEELMEAKLDRYNQKKSASHDDDSEDKPARKPRKTQSESLAAKEGRWVAPIILGLTVLVSLLLWAWPR